MGYDMQNQQIHGNQYNAGRDIHIVETPKVDPLETGRDNAKRGYKALLRGDYATAQRYLEEASSTLPEDQLPAEIAQVKYYFALALLQGKQPFWATLSDMRRIEQLLRSAIDLHPLHSYYHTLALFKQDFARHGLLPYKRDAQKLRQKALHSQKTEIDEGNLRLLAQCQAQLVKSNTAR